MTDKKLKTKNILEQGIKNNEKVLFKGQEVSVVAANFKTGMLTIEIDVHADDVEKQKRTVAKPVTNQAVG